MERPRFAACLLASLAAATLAPTAAARPEGDPDGVEAPAAQQDSATSLIEQAAYAEEHERDFTKALSLLRRALDAAQKAQDAALAKKAQDALARLAARMSSGESGGTAPADAQQGSDADAITTRIADLMDSVARMPLNTNQYATAKRDLTLYGDAAARWVAQATVQRVELAGYKISPSAERFVDVLVGMDSPGATKALEELTRSPDPLVRHWMAEIASPVRHRELLLKLLQDPAPSVREQALHTLAGGQGDDLAPIMQRAARSGDGSAIGWMLQWRTVEAFALLNQEDVAEGVQETLLRFCDADLLPARAEIADASIRFAGSQASDVLRRMAIERLRSAVEGSWSGASPELRSRIEAGLVTSLERQPKPEAWFILLDVGGARSLEPLVDSFVATGQSADLGSSALLYQGLLKLLGSLTAEDFPTLTTALARVPVPQGRSSGGGNSLFEVLTRSLSAFQSADLPPAEVVAGLERMPAAARDAYLGFATRWLQLRLQAIDLGPTQGGARTRLDPVLVSLVRALAASGSQDTDRQRTVLNAYGALGDPALLPELLALPQYLTDELRRPVATLYEASPNKAAAAVQGYLDSALRAPPAERADVFERIAVLPTSQVLPLFRRYWPQVDDDASRLALLRVLIGRTSGPEASAVVLEHFGDVPAGPLGDVLQAQAVKRFGEELYEPALAVLGEALRHPSLEVRQRATQAYAQFRSYRQTLEEFEAWRNADPDGQQTIGELIALLSSSDPAIVVQAVKALGALKARAAYPAMIRLMERHDASIDAAVEQAVDALGQ